MKDGPAGKIDAAASTVLVLGVLSVALGAFQAVVPVMLGRLAGSLDMPDDPTRPLRDALAAGSGMSAAFNLAFGVAALVTGIATLRRARFAHRAVTLLCWGSILMLLAIAKPTLAPLLVLSGDGALARIGLFALAIVLLVAQIAAVVWFLKFWGREEVRSAFR